MASLSSNRNIILGTFVLYHKNIVSKIAHACPTLGLAAPSRLITIIVIVIIVITIQLMFTIIMSSITMQD